MEHILSSQLIISLFIILILYNQKSSFKYPSEKVLFYYLLLLMLRSTIEILTNNLSYLLKFRYLVFVNQSTYFLDGLFIYIYVLVLNNKKIVSLKTILFALPFLVFFSLTVLIAYQTDTEVLREFIIGIDEEKVTNDWNTTGALYFIMVITYNLLMYIYSLHLFNKGSKGISNTVSVIHDLSYSWQKTFINSWFILYFIPFAATFIVMYFRGVSSDITEIIFAITTFILTFILGLKKIKIRYEELKYNNQEVTLKKLIKPKNKYGTLKLDTDKTAEMKIDIEKLVGSIEILSDLDLNLASFSNKLNEKEYLVSQVINTLYHKNFQDFINEHRVDYAKKLLTENPDYKIVHVALDCGYKSTVTFNRQFKKHTGMTPTEFKNSFS
mgnify:CR=1 FL=1